MSVCGERVRYGVRDKGKVYDVRVGYGVWCEAKPWKG